MCNLARYSTADEWRAARPSKVPPPPARIIAGVWARSIQKTGGNSLASVVLSTAIVLTPAQPPRLLDLVRQVGWQRFGRSDAAEAWVEWMRRFILFHNKRHPREMGAAEIGAFL